VKKSKSSLDLECSGLLRYLVALCVEVLLTICRKHLRLLLFRPFFMVDIMADARDEKVSDFTTTSPQEDREIDDDPQAHTEKTFWERSWPTFACGAGLWSDGYLQYVSYLPTHPFLKVSDLMTGFIGYWHR
jgi:hypothetical protein